MLSHIPLAQTIPTHSILQQQTSTYPTVTLPNNSYMLPHTQPYSYSHSHSQSRLSDPNSYNPSQSNIIKLNSTFEYPTQRNFITIRSPYSKYCRDGMGEEMDFGGFRFGVFDVMNTANRGYQHQQPQQKHSNINKQPYLNNSNPQITTNPKTTSTDQYPHKSSDFTQQLSIKKPQPFMGAFLHTQKQFNCFDLNIKIPPLKQVLPFSRILNQSLWAGAEDQHLEKQREMDRERQREKKQKQKLSKRQEQQQAKQKQKKNKKKLAQQNQDLRYKHMSQFQRFLSESLYQSKFLQSQNQWMGEQLNNQSNNQKKQDLALKDLQISKIQNKQQPSQQQVQPNQSPFPCLLQSSTPESLQLQHQQLLQQTMWQQADQQLRQQIPDFDFDKSFNHVYQFHKSKCNEFIEMVESRIMLKERARFFTQPEVISCLVKMMLGVQSELFVLDYVTLQWKVTCVPVRFEHILKTSFHMHLQDILTIANHKSRLQTALTHIKPQNYRRILQQISFQSKNLLTILEQICLQVLKRNGTFLDFVLTITEIKSEISLIYELLINEAWVKGEGKSYMDFEVGFLNSEAVIFRQIVRLSNTNDSLVGKGYQICLKLLRAVFKPITFTLNRIVFQETVEISNRDDTYLRYYFENLKDLLSYLGKRIDLIKQQSNQLYIICRIKQQIKIVMQTNELHEYIAKWNQVFATKRKKIEQIQRREKKRLKEQKQKKQQDKIKQIYQLKSRLYNSIEQTKKRKSQIYQQGVKQIQRLKKDIKERQQRRRLNYLIEKQQQKGFLLQAQLKQKRKLIHQKQQLLEIAQKQGLKLVLQTLKFNNIIEQSPNEVQKINQKSKQNQQSIIKFKSEQVVSIGTQKAQNKNQNKVRTTTSLDMLMQNKQQPKMQLVNPSRFQQSSQKKKAAQVQQINVRSQKEMQVLGQSHNFQQQSENQQQKSQKQQQALNPNSDPQPHNPPAQHQHQPQQQPDNSPIHVSTNTVLALCIDNIIRQQIEITNMALSYLVYDRYQLFNLMEFMRKIFLHGNGEAITNFLHVSTTSDSRVNLQFFHQALLFDYADQFVRSLEPQFYEVHNMPALRSQNQIARGASIFQNRQINLFQDSLQISLGFQFAKLPVMLEPYFSYIHLSKYMQIFSYAFKIRHCQNLVSSCLLCLNQHKKHLEQDLSDKSFLKKLYLTRQTIHLYLRTLSSYFFYRVIQKQIKTVRTKLKNKDINELSIVHLNMLDTIIRKGLIQNSHNDISKKIKLLLLEIRKFKNIVDSFCANDIHSYVRREIQGQVGNMHRVFLDEQRFLETLFYHP